MTISYQPQIWDVRPDDAGSISTLPKLTKDDWFTLKDFMQAHWPEFDIIGDLGEQRAQPGQRWWAIGAIEVKEGPAVFQIQFRQDADTYDDGNILSFFSWADAPELDPAVDVRYYGQAVYSFSNGADSVGYPHGSVSGPYAMWLNSDPEGWQDRRVGSDCIKGLHWFDNHVCLNSVFWPMRKEGDPPTTTKYLANVDKTGRITDHIEFRPGAPPLGNAGLVLLEDGEVTHWIAWTPRGV